MPRNLICRTCMTSGEPKRTPSGLGIVLALVGIVWLAYALFTPMPAFLLDFGGTYVAMLGPPAFFIIAGILVPKPHACRSCGSREVIPLDSPAGQMLFRQANSDGGKGRSMFE